MNLCNLRGIPILIEEVAHWPCSNCTNLLIIQHSLKCASNGK